MTDIIIFGAGQFAEVLTTYIQQDTEDNIIGYTVDKEFCTKNEFYGQPLVPWEELEQYFPVDQVKILGPISYNDANKFRKERFLEGKKRGYQFYSFIHPAAYIYSKKIGENVIILEGNTVQPFVEIGDNCILWSNSHIGHHTKVSSHCFITSRVTIGGNSIIEEGVFLSGCIVRDNITIGAWSILTPGTYASTDIPENSILAKPQDKLIKDLARSYSKTILG